MNEESFISVLKAALEKDLLRQYPPDFDIGDVVSCGHHHEGGPHHDDSRRRKEPGPVGAMGEEDPEPVAERYPLT